MRHAAVAVALAAALFTADPAPAREVGGVQLPETLAVSGRTLRLNGAGVRRKFIFSVYVGALYVETRASDPAALIASDAPWALKLHFLRDVDHDRILEACRDAFEGESPGLLARLRPGLEQLRRELLGELALRSGQELIFSYAPGDGMRLTAPDGSSARVVDKVFADAILLAWLGDHAEDGGLREALLGRETVRQAWVGPREP